MTELVVEIWTWIADSFSSVWAWLTGTLLFLGDWVVLRGLIRRAITTGIRKSWRWLAMGFIEQVASVAQPGVAKRLEKSWQESLKRTSSEWWHRTEQKDSERWARIEQMISERLAQLNPEPPPHGITGEPCPKSGLYRVQCGGLYVVERTFEKGEIFPTASTRFGEVAGLPLALNEEKVTWVYQIPKNDK